MSATTCRRGNASAMARPVAIRQRGAALFLVLLLIVIGTGIVFVSRLKSADVELEAQRKTAAALAEAKQALLGYAASDANRPGSLPCADVDNDGDTTIGVDFSCVPQVIGRVPWKLLGLTDLRDGNGERLWYAVSPDFRAFLNPVTHPLNSKVAGQITLRNSSGTIVNDAGATPSTGVVAVIVAPGAVLTRQGTGVPQDRSCNGGGGCTTDLRCQVPYQSVAMCNPINYLDAVMFEDNANFIADTSTNGLVYGPVTNSTGATLLNDRVLAITQSDLNTVITLRMARELSQHAYGPGGVGTPGVTTVASIPPSDKPPVWVQNQWDNAVDTAASGVTGSTITLKFVSCGIVYTITGPNAVTRSAGSC